ncbi:Uncharacterised protein [Vibrio cholerae]|nr:Uncharacterised protein [Vibrio cholerae]
MPAPDDLAIHGAVAPLQSPHTNDSSGFLPLFCATHCDV